jgi:ribosomal 50S subunit-recycling heat shock protein
MYTQDAWLKESLIKWRSKLLHLVKGQIKLNRSHIRMSGHIKPEPV